MYYTTEALTLEHAEGIKLTYRGHNYALYGEWEGKISRYMLDNETEPYSIAFCTECDAKEIGKDNYITLCWSAEPDDPYAWLEELNGKWNTGISAKDLSKDLKVHGNIVSRFELGKKI